MSGSRSAPAALGKYQIRGVLGRGAMGTVYDGWDPVIGRRVAIKTVRLLDPDDAEAHDALARFKNEAQAAGRLSHRNIVSVYDYGELDENAYIVMEFVEGQSLKQCLDAGQRFRVSETVRIMEHLLAGLQYSHDKGVMHRDIKPGNVILANDGQVKLADFGIARIESSVMTVVGTVLGTPAYMSPEQLMGQSIDRRSDIYSAGVLLYQLLTGVRPFEGSLTAIMHKALNTTPPRPSELAVAAPASLDPVVARAMAKQSANRFPNAAAFARAIRKLTKHVGVVTESGQQHHCLTRTAPIHDVQLHTWSDRNELFLVGCGIDACRRRFGAGRVNRTKSEKKPQSAQIGCLRHLAVSPYVFHPSRKELVCQVVTDPA